MSIMGTAIDIHQWDKCNYELVDLEKDTVVKTFYDIACSEAFDTCAAKRDQLNQNKEIKVQRYACLEKIDPNLSSDDNYDNIPGMVNHLSESEISQIEEFLNSKTLSKLFRTGRKGYKGCSIEKIKGNACNFMIKVDGNSYPMTDGSVCSNSAKTKANYYGCEGSSQRSTAACLFALAVSEGYCL
jgi:hypothetical protein